MFHIKISDTRGFVFTLSYEETFETYNIHPFISDSIKMTQIYLIEKETEIRQAWRKKMIHEGKFLCC